MSFTFQQALTGLDASAQQLDVLGNNIANSATTAFKRSRVSFGDVYANSVSATNNNPIGLGVSVQSITQAFTQGGLTTTNNPLDLGISGDGFFVVKDVSTGETLYSRAGQLNVDAEGFLVTPGGQRVRGYSPSATEPRNGPPDIDLQVPTGSKDATVTTKIDASFNLNAADPIKTTTLNGSFDPSRADSYNNATSVTVFDKVGSPHNLTLYFRRVDSLRWEVYSRMSDGNNTLTPQVTTPAPATPPASPGGADTPVVLEFSGAGVLQSPGAANALLSFDLTNTPNGSTPTATTPFAFRLNLASSDTNDTFATTAFADRFAPSKLQQDGRQSGSLAGFSIDNDGNLVARYSNGLTDIKGQIALANFKTPEKLRSVTGNLYAATEESGRPQSASPNSNTSNGRLGVIKPGTLELSNVDLTVELVGLITAQRNYQANAKTIQVQNQAAQAILQAV